VQQDTCATTIKNAVRLHHAGLSANGVKIAPNPGEQSKKVKAAHGKNIISSVHLMRR
jgi:hypothetical protein